MARFEVDAGIDVSQLDKDLKRVRRKVESLKESIEKNKIRLNLASESEAEIKASLKLSKQRLAELEETAQNNKGSLKGDMALQEIPEAKKEVADLTKEYNKAHNAVNRINEQVRVQDEVLERLENKESEIVGQIQARELAEQRATQATENAETVQEASADAVEETTDAVEDGTEAMEELGDASEDTGVRTEDALDRIGRRLKGLAKRVLFFSLFTRLLRSFVSYIGGVISSNDEAAQSIGRLKGAFETLLSPLLSAIIPVLVTVVNWITRIINAIIQLIALLTGKTVEAMQNTAKNAKKTAGATGKATKSLAAFDTVQKLSSGSSGGGGSSGSSIEPIYDLGEMTKGQMAEILGIVLAIGSAIAAWRMGTGLLGALKIFISLAAIIIGLVIAVKNYLDAWNNGITMDNLSDMLGGIILLLAGVFGLLGPVAMGFVAIASGVALVVLAFRDMSQNGVNLQNTLTLVFGALLIGIGLFAATWNAIFAVIGVIAAAVLAVMGFGGTLGKFVESVKGIFSGLITFFTGVFTGDWEMAWEGLKEVFKNIWNAILAIFGGAWNAMIRGINFVIDKINSLSWDVPDWVPFIGGQHWGFNFGHVSEWSIPYLAQGAVIPPNREFMAVLGDQKSGTNIEAPLETIVQAFRMAGGGSQNINIRFTGPLADVARMLKPEIDKEGFREGRVIGGTL